MINISKSGNAIKFAFTDSDHYLYGNGEIEVPVNSLSLIVDESNMVTFRKANSNDIFLSFDPANSNLSDKAGVIDFYKTNMVGSTGGEESGITSGEVQTMIDNSLEDYYTDDEVDAALSGKADASNVYTIAETNYLLNDLSQRKADISAVTAVENDVLTLQDALAGKANTSALTAHTSDTGIHVSTQEKNAWNAKLDASAYTPVDLSEYWTSAQTEASIESATSGKADTTAVTAVNDALTAHTSDTDIHVTQADKTSWNAKAEPYSAGTGIEISGNVISATGGGGATYSAGTNISIDTGNTISCTLPIYSGTGTNSLALNGSENIVNEWRKANGLNSISYGSYSKAYKPFALAGGRYVTAQNYGEVSVGFFNQSNGSSDSLMNDSGNTLFSVGNGTAANARHNAFEIRQNGDIYITSGGTDIKLQDNLGGGGGGGSVTVDSYLDNQSTNPVENQVISQAFEGMNTFIDTKADQSELYYLLGGSTDEYNPVTPIRLMRISQSDYNDLADGDGYDPDVLYIITPDEE